MRCSTGVFLALLCLLTTTATFARPELVQTMDRVDIAGRSITLDGKTYKLADKVRWVGLGERRPEDVIPLMSGKRIGVVVEYTGKNAEVTEVWAQ